MRFFFTLFGMQAVFLAFSVSLGWSSASADWPRFRGPDGRGISSDVESLPTQWSEEKNLAWKVELPGAGVSSPIVVADRVFVTCYSGYGLDRSQPGKIQNLKRHLVCVDARSGNIQWQRTVDAVQPEDPYEGVGVTAHGYASHTPVSDGEHVFAFFGKSGVHAFDLEGNPLWQTSVGTGSDPMRWGSSSSPILHDDLLIVTASAESRALVALDKRTGKELWREEAEGLGNVWGTPILVDVNEQRTDLVLGVPYEFWGLNPATGKLRWFAEVMESDQYNSSVVEAGGVIYGIEGRGGGSIAIKSGGEDDVTESGTLWTGTDSARFGSPLVLDGRIYYFANGVANCIRSEDGTSVFKGRLPGASRDRDGNRGGPADARDERETPRGNGEGFGGRGGFSSGGFGGGPGGRGGFGGSRGGFGVMDYASPVAGDGKIYYLQGDGTTHVMKSGDEFDLLASNKLGGEGESFGGTPAIADGNLYLRSNQHLYCITQQ